MSGLLWKPTLAATLPAKYDLETLPYPLYVSPKIDGVRAMVQRGVVVSRNGRAIPQPAVQQLFGSAVFEGLDIELTVGSPWDEGVFTRTASLVMRAKPADKALARELRANVLDWYGDLPYSERVGIVKEAHGWRKGGGVYVVKQTLVRSADQLLAYEDTQLKRGYEGVMLRSSDAGEYLQKRSTLREFFLVKLKRFDHGTGTIINFHPLEHNLNKDKTTTGRRSTKKVGIVADSVLVGSVTLRDGHYEFSVNVQTDVLRGKGHAWWTRQIGGRVRYTHQSVGRKEQPRFPQCKFEELV